MCPPSVLDFVDDSAALALLTSAVQCPSVTGDEMDFARLVRTELEAAGADQVELFEAAPGRPVIWTLTRGRGEAPPLLLAGHLDTVPVLDWAEHWEGTARQDPFSATVADGALWGRGAADMKGGIVAAISALRALHRARVRPKGDVITLWVCDEESGVPGMGRSLGMRAAVGLIGSGAIPRPHFALYLEPTRLAVCTAQPPFLIAHIAIGGKSAYFGYPEHGIDALRVGHAAVQALWDLNDAMQARGNHRLIGKRRLLVTGMNAGGLVAVPGSCAIDLIATLLPNDDLSATAAEITKTVEGSVTDTGTTVTLTYPDGRDHDFGGLGFDITPGAGVDALRAAANAVSPGSGTLEAVPYWSEGSLLVRIGVPTAYWGPGFIAHCHTENERLDLEELRIATNALTLFLHGTDDREG
jgi:acetylornithine deacetylase/succinyl-diaminopimelate desuccinylase-like protein